ncbi:Serine/threonine-protein kinase domain-containing protein 2 [Rozella allomycis CSF55]|uniref:Serine/threonine-protein kinase domain-containing protein 2 n=1 Tax=Rozella allomycis (strain CSF55) TaxID=988480 RepID=A0A075AYE5_ROZAC|nr:Serine/threonine-protein kinase domain-containing protein 2 [Rozella allomycis CSF55]|eukprot:EPZ35302.1 Serine/threonine-protein kinase domain-containing protein 2 [Rozella allomycis CSF55]
MEMKLQELELRHGNVCKELELSEFKRGVLEQDIEVLTENIRVEKNEKEEILAECLHLEDLLKKENENNKRLILQHELNIQRLNEELASSKLAILEAEKKMVAIVYENKEKLDFYEKSNALVQKELKESIELNTSIQISNTELLKGKELNEQQLNEREAQIKDLIAENESLLSMSESLNLEFNELKDKLQKTDEYGRTEIENLTKLIAQTSAEKERINEAFHRIEKENVNMSNQLDHLRLDIKKSKYHTGVHHFYIERLESKVDACEMALKDTNAELNAIKSLNRKLTSEIVEYSNMNADLKSLGQSLKDENEVFKVKCQQLEKIENQYSQLKLEHEIVKIANDQNSKMYEESKKELETISNDLTKGKLLEQEFKDEIEFWKRQNDLLQQKLLMSSNEYNICKFEYDRVQKQLTECSRQLEDANSVIKRQSECLEANEYSLEDLKITLNTNNQKYMASKDIIDDLEKKLDKKELEISKLKESISNLDLDYVSLKVRYKDQVSTNQNLSTEIQNLRSTNVELINEKEKIEAALHKKQEEFMHISTITASSGTVDLEKNILIDQIAHLNFQIDLSKKENLQLENRLSEMSSTIRTLFENEKVHVSEESQIISLEKHELDDKNIVFDKYNDLQNKYKAVEAEYRHKISGLECWLSETDVLLKQKDAKIKLLEAENNSLQNNLNDKIDALDLLRNNVKEISSYLQDLEFQLQQSKEEKCLLRQKIENEIAQYKASESNVLNLRVLNGKLLHELKNEKTLRQEAQEKLKNDEILVSKSNQISNLNQKIDSLNQQVLQLNRENSVLIIRARNFENVVHKQDSKIVDLQRSLENKENEFQENLRSFEVLKSQLSTLEGENKRLDRIKVDKEAEIKFMKESLATFHSWAVAVESKQQENEVYLKQLRQTNDSLNYKTCQLESELKSLTNQHEKKCEELTALERKLEEQKECKSVIENELDMVKQQLMQKEVALKDLSVKFQSLLDENIVLKQQTVPKVMINRASSMMINEDIPLKHDQETLCNLIIDESQYVLMKTDYEKKILELEAKCDLYSDNLHKLELESQNRTEELFDKTKSNKDLTNQLKEIKNNFNTIENSFNEKCKEIEEMESTNDSLGRRLLILENEKAQLLSEIDELNEEIVILKESDKPDNVVPIIKKPYSVEIIEENRFADAQTQASFENQEASTEIDSHQDEIAQLNERIASLKFEYSALEKELNAKLDEKQCENESLKEKIEKLLNENAVIRDKFNVNPAPVSIVDVEYTKELNNKYLNKIKENTKMQEELEELKKYISASEQLSCQNELKLSLMEKELARSIENNVAIKSECLKLNEVLEAKNRQLSDMEVIVQELRVEKSNLINASMDQQMIESQTISHYEAEITKLKESINNNVRVEVTNAVNAVDNESGLQEKIKSSQDDNLRLESMLKDYAQKIQTLNESRSQLSKELGNLQSENRSLGDKLCTQNIYCSKLESQLRILENEKMQAVLEREAVEGEIDKCKKIETELSKRCVGQEEMYRSANARLQDSLRDVERMLELKTDELARVVMVLDAKNAGIKELEEEMEKMRVSLVEFETAKRQLETNNGMFRVELETKKTVIENILKEKQSLEESMMKMHAVKAMLPEVDLNEDYEINVLKKQVQSLSGRVEELTNEKNKFENEVVKMAAETTGLKICVNGLEIDKSNLIDGLRVKNSEYEKLEAILDEINEKMRTIEEELKSLNDVLEKTREESIELNEKHMSLINERNSLLKMINNLQEQLEERERVIVKLENEIEANNKRMIGEMDKMNQEAKIKQIEMKNYYESFLSQKDSEIQNIINAAKKETKEKSTNTLNKVMQQDSSEDQRLELLADYQIEIKLKDCKINDQELEIKEIKQENVKFREELIQSRAAVESSNSINQSQVEKMKEIQNSFNELSKKYTQLLKERTNLEFDFEQHRIDKGKLENVTSQLNKENEYIKNQINDLQKEREILHNEFVNSKNQVSSLYAVKQDMDALLEFKEITYQSSIKDMENKINEAYQLIESKESRIKLLEESITQLQMSLDSKTQMQPTSVPIDASIFVQQEEMVVKLSEMTLLNYSLEDKIDSLKLKIANMATTVHEYEDRGKVLIEKIEKLMEEKKMLKRNIADLEISLDQSRNVIEKDKREIQRLEVAVFELNENFSVVNKRVGEVEFMYYEKTRECDLLGVEIVRGREEKERIFNENRIVEEELKERIAKEVENVKGLQSEIEKIKSEKLSVLQENQNLVFEKNVLESNARELNEMNEILNKSLEETRSLLKKQAEKNIEERDHVSGDRVEVYKDRDEVFGMIKIIEKERDEIQNHLNKAELKIHELELKGHEREMEFQLLRESLFKQQEESKLLKEEINEKEESLIKLENSLKENELINKNLKIEIEEKEIERNKMMKELNSFKQINENLQNRFEKIEIENERMKIENKTINEKNTRLNKEINNLEKRNEILHLDLKEKNLILANQEKEISRIKELENTVKENEELINSLKNDNSNLKREKEEGEKMVKALKNEKNELNHNLEISETEIESLKNEINSSKVTIEEIIKEMKIVKNENETFQKQINVYKEGEELLKKSLDNGIKVDELTRLLQSKLIEKQTRIEELNLQVIKVENENESLRNELKALNVKHEKEMIEFVNEKEEIKRNRKDLKDLKKVVDELNRIIKDQNELIIKRNENERIKLQEITNVLNEREEENRVIKNRLKVKEEMVEKLLNEKDEIENSLKRKNETIQGFENENIDLKIEIELIIKEKEDYEKKIKDLKGRDELNRLELKEKNHRILELENELKYLKETICKNEKDLNEMNKKIINLENENAEIENEMKKIKIENKEKVEELNKEISIKENLRIKEFEEKENSISKNRLLENELNLIKEELKGIEKLRIELVEKSAKINELEIEINDKNDAILELNRNILHFQNLIVQLEKDKIESLKDNVEKVEIEMEASSQDMAIQTEVGENIIKVASADNGTDDNKSNYSTIDIVDNSNTTNDSMLASNAYISNKQIVELELKLNQVSELNLELIKSKNELQNEIENLELKINKESDLNMNLVEVNKSLNESYKELLMKLHDVESHNADKTNQIELLKVRINEIENELKIKDSENSNLENNFQNQQKEFLNLLNSEKKELNYALENKNKKIIELETVLNALTINIQDISKLLQKSNLESGLVIQSKNNLEIQLAENEKELIKLKQEIKEKQSEFELLENERLRNKNVINEMKMKCLNLETEHLKNVKQFEDEIENLKLSNELIKEKLNVSNEKESNVTNLAIQIQGLQQDLLKQGKDLNNLKNENNKLNKLIIKEKENKYHLQSQLQNILNSKQLLEDEMKLVVHEKESAIKDVNKLSLQLNETKSEFLNKILELNKIKLDYENEFIKHQNQIKELLKEKENLKSLNEMILTKLKQEQSENSLITKSGNKQNELEFQFEKIYKENEKLLKENSVLLENVKELKIEISESKNRNEELENEEIEKDSIIVELKDINKRLNDKVEEYKEEIKDYQIQINQFKQDINTLNERIVKIEDATENYKLEITRVIDEKEKEIEKLVNEYEKIDEKSKCLVGEMEIISNENVKLLNENNLLMKVVKELEERIKLYEKMESNFFNERSELINEIQESRQKIKEYLNQDIQLTIVSEPLIVEQRVEERVEEKSIELKDENVQTMVNSSEIEQLIIQLESVTAEKEYIQVVLNERNNKISELVDEIESLKPSVPIKQDVKSVPAFQMKDKDNLVEILENEIKIKSEEIESLKKAIEIQYQINETLKLQNETPQVNHPEIDQLKSEINSLKFELDAKEKDIKSMRNNYEHELDRLKMDIHNLQNELSDKELAFKKKIELKESEILTLMLQKRKIEESFKEFELRSMETIKDLSEKNEILMNENGELIKYKINQENLLKEIEKLENILENEVEKKSELDTVKKDELHERNKNNFKMDLVDLAVKKFNIILQLKQQEFSSKVESLNKINQFNQEEINSIQSQLKSKIKENEDLNLEFNLYKSQSGTQIKDLNLKVTNLKEEMKSLKLKCLELENLNNSLNLNLLDSATSLEKKTLELKALQNELSTKIDEMNVLNIKLLQLESIPELLKLENNKLNEINLELKNNVEIGNEKIKNYILEISELKTRVDQLTRENESLKELNGLHIEMCDKYNKLVKEKESLLNEKEQELKRIIKDLEVQYDEEKNQFEMKFSECRNELLKAKQEYSTLVEKNQLDEAMIEQLNLNNKILNETIQLKSTEFKKIHDELNGNLLEVNERLNNSNIEINLLKVKLNEKLNEIDKQKTENEELEISQAKNLELIKKTTDALQVAIADNNDHKTRVEDLSRIKNEMEMELKCKAVQLDQVNVELKENSEKCSEYLIKMKSFKKELDEIEFKFGVSNKENNELRLENGKMNVESLKLKEDKELIENELKLLKIDFAECLNDFGKLKNEKESNEGRLSELEKQVEEKNEILLMLTNKNKCLEEENLVLKKEKIENENEMQGLNNEISELKREIELIENKLNDSLMNKIELNKRVEYLEKEFNESNEQLKRTGIVCEHVKGEAKLLMARLKSQEAINFQLEQEKSKLEDSFNEKRCELMNELETFKLIKASYEKDLLFLENKVKSQILVINEKSKTIYRLEELVEFYEKKNEEIKEELEKIKGWYLKKKSENNELEILYLNKFHNLLNQVNKEKLEVKDFKVDEIKDVKVEDFKEFKADDVKVEESLLLNNQRKLEIEELNDSIELKDKRINKLEFEIKDLKNELEKFENELKVKNKSEIESKNRIEILENLLEKSEKKNEESLKIILEMNQLPFDYLNEIKLKDEEIKKLTLIIGETKLKRVELVNEQVKEQVKEKVSNETTKEVDESAKDKVSNREEGLKRDVLLGNKNVSLTNKETSLEEYKMAVYRANKELRQWIERKKLTRLLPVSLNKKDDLNSLIEELLTLHQTIYDSIGFSNKRIEKEYPDLIAQINTQQELIKNYQLQITLQQDDIISLSNQINSLKSSVNENPLWFKEKLILLNQIETFKEKMDSNDNNQCLSNSSVNNSNDALYNTFNKMFKNIIPIDSDLNKSFSLLYQFINKLKSELNSLQNENNKKQSQIDFLSKSLNSIQLENKNLNNKIDSLNIEILNGLKSTKTKGDVKEESTIKDVDELSPLKEETESSSSNLLDKYTSEIEILNSLRLNLLKQNQQLSIKLSEQDKIINHLSIQLNQIPLLNTQINALQSHSSNLNNKINIIISSIHSILSYHFNLEVTENNIDELFSILESQIENIKSESNTCKQQLQNSFVQVDVWKNHYDQQKRENSHLISLITQ